MKVENTGKITLAEINEEVRVLKDEFSDIQIRIEDCKDKPEDIIVYVNKAEEIDERLEELLALVDKVEY